MARRELTVQRYEEIKRRLAEGRSVREIASALSCSRRLVREIRDGVRVTHAIAASPDPLWMSQLYWPLIIHELGLGHPLKFIWEEKAQHLTTYSNFWKRFYRKFPQCRDASVTARTLEPGERVEVDYAGEAIEWYDIKTGEIHKAYVLVAGLGFSQLLFAWAAEDMKSRNWIASHRRMYAYYNGVPQTSKAFDVCGNPKDPVMRRKRPVHCFSQGERAAELLIICARFSQRVEPREQCGLALPTRWLAWPC
jgi:hypothetical protein